MTMTLLGVHNVIKGIIRIQVVRTHVFDVQITQQHNLLDQKASAIVLVRTFKKCLKKQSFSIDLMKFISIPKMLANLVFGLHMELQNVLCALLDHIQTTLEHLNVQNAPLQNQPIRRVPTMNHFVKASFLFNLIYCFYSMYQ